MPNDNIWYFAYGSNMSTAKFTGGRGIVPLAVARVRIPNYTFAMNIPGVPYSEPAFSAIKPLAGAASSSPHSSICDAASSSGSQSLARFTSSEKPANTRSPIAVVGVAYLVTPPQYNKILGSEGGGIAYKDVAIYAEPLEPEDEVRTGPKPLVRTLVAVVERDPNPRPSKRYMVSCSLPRSRTLDGPIRPVITQLAHLRNTHLLANRTSFSPELVRQSSLLLTWPT
jgi:hypothetical protein